MGQKKKYKFESALKAFREDIASGNYKTGTFLPTERELTEIYDVSRGTMRSVLKQLSDEGIIRINPGKGILVIGEDLQQNLRKFMVKATFNYLSKYTEGVGLITGICQAASKHNAEVVFSFEKASPDSCSEIIKKYNSGEIQGVITGDCFDYNDYAATFDKLGIPYVSSNLEHNFNIPAARMDFREVGRKAGRYLVQLGHKKIAVISGPLKDFIYKEMLAGFKGALAEEEIAVGNDNIFEVESDLEKARLLCLDALKQMKELPTAVFTSRDIRAGGFYSACRELGIKIPDDISVISYDNITWQGTETAGLTTIRENIEEIGEAAVEMLAEWITTHERPRNRIFTGELIIRSSCRPLKQL